MKNYLLGIDCGTESVRAGIFDLEGKIIGMGYHQYNTYHEHTGWAEQRIEEWEEALIKSIKMALDKSEIDPTLIAGVGYDCTCCSVVFIDKNGKSLRNPIIWMDIRSKEEAKFIESIDDPARSYNGYGSVSAEWFPCKVLWVKKNQPEIYKNSKIIAEYTDWVTHRMTGNWNLGITTITLRAYYNNRDGGWPKNFYKKIGLSDIFEKLPGNVYRLGSFVGTLQKEFADKTGLPESIPVAQGGIDGTSAVIGANSFHSGQVFLIGGSSSYIAPHFDKEFHKNGLFGSFPDMILDNFSLEAGQTSSGSVLKWFTSNFISEKIQEEAKDRGLSIYSYLDNEASKLPAGSEGIIVLEHWQGNRTPFVDPESRGVIRGLSLKHKPVHIYRAIMEGVAYGIETNLRILRGNNIKVDELIACGGHMRSSVWPQIYADVIGIELKIPENIDTAVLGSAILAGVVSKKFIDITDGANKMVKTKEVIKPNMENHKKYMFFLDHYLKTYNCLKDSIHKTSSFYQI